MSNPAFQFYPKQWLGDDKIMLMDWTARAMHLHFMCIAWQQEDFPCSLPNDDKMLRKLAGNPRDWGNIRAQIFNAWVLENDRFVQKGLLREYMKQKAFSESRSNNAKKRVYASAKQVQCIGVCTDDALQSSSSSSNIIVSKDTIVFDDKNGHCPHQEIINLYHKYLPVCPEIVKWTNTRSEHLRARWKEDKERQDLSWWEWFFQEIAKSKFLTGKISTQGKKTFVASLDWIVKPENFTKILEGRYS
jgi:uncharacterized protein YdaU (DUF1376 family)